MKQSIVIRGSLSYPHHPINFIDIVVSEIRKWFHDEIILSTWHGQEQYISKNLPINKLVLTTDPGPGPIQHLNRQVLSYVKGLEQASGDEAIVTRSDIVLTKNLFNLRGQFEKTTDHLKVFKNKLLIPNIMTINPDSTERPNTFRVCDWLQVGDIEDLKKWANIQHEIYNVDLAKLQNSSCCTETFWFLSVLKSQYPHVDIYNSSSIDYFAWNAIINNFVVLNMHSSMNAMNMNWTGQAESFYAYITESTYQAKYKELTT